MKEKSDIAIIEQIKAGDEQAFSIIVKRYQQQVARTVIGMLGKTDEADDVGQEVFIRFYNAIEQYRGESALGTYLSRIAINLSLNALKKNKRKRLFTTFSNDQDNNNNNTLDNKVVADDEFKAKDQQELVQLALSYLDPKFRSIIVLRMLEGYSTKETAETLNIPTGTVLSRLSRAQDKLKEALTKLGYQHGN